MNADPGRLRSAALMYAGRAGWKVFPVWGIVNGKCECNTSHLSPKDGGKHPVSGRGHKDATVDPDILGAFWPDPAAGGSSHHNIGVPCDSNGMVVVDIDPRHGGPDSLARLEADYEPLPGTLAARTGRWGETGRGRHLYFRVQDGYDFHAGIDGYPGIDIKHKGYVLAAPSLHFSGETYEWEVPGGPLTTGVADLPDWLAKLVLKGRSRAAGGGDDLFGVLDWGGKKIDVDAVLAKGIHDGERHDVFYPMMCALANQYPIDTGHGEASLRRLLHGINQKHVFPPLDDDDFKLQSDRAIQFVKDNPKNRGNLAALGPGVLEWVAEASRPAVTDPSELRAAASAAAAGSPEVATGASGGASGGGAPPAGAAAAAAAAPEPAGTAPLAARPVDVDEVDEPGDGTVLRRSCTDVGNARRLTDYFAGRVRYTDGMGWFSWHEGLRYWEPDYAGSSVLERAKVCSTLVVRELAGLEPSSEAAKNVAKWAMDSKSTGRLKSAMDLWKVDSRRVKAPVSNWDSHAELLGVKNGVVDLKTGELLRGEPHMGITKRTSAAYERGMRATQWDEFLSFATGGDVELQRWLQLAAGYTLTGRRDFDVFFIVFGLPGSGKSTFLEALSHVLGEDYAISLPVSTLIDEGGKSSSDPYYWAQLPGKRMAMFSEWPTGKRTKEDAIKQLTGDMTATGRHPGGQPFVFQSQAKLWLGTNTTPAINDQAMWRRIRAIHFPHVPEKPNPDLKPWLSDPEGGLPAVMSWCVEGAVRLLNSPERDALGWCRAVADASAEYRAQEDRMGQFLSEETRVVVGGSVATSELYEVYRAWAEDRGEKPMTRVPFEKAMAERGLTVRGRGREGSVADVALKPRVAGWESPSAIEAAAAAWLGPA